MPQTRDIGRTYVHALKYPMRGAPRYERAWTVEVEPPYRRGKAVAIRFGRYRALVFGRWGQPTYNEDSALRAISSDLDVPVEEIREWLG